MKAQKNNRRIVFEFIPHAGTAEFVLSHLPEAPIKEIWWGCIDTPASDIVASFGKNKDGSEDLLQIQLPFDSPYGQTNQWQFDPSFEGRGGSGWAWVPPEK